MVNLFSSFLEDYLDVIQSLPIDHNATQILEALRDTTRRFRLSSNFT